MHWKTKKFVTSHYHGVRPVAAVSPPPRSPKGRQGGRPQAQPYPKFRAGQLITQHHYGHGHGQGSASDSSSSSSDSEDEAKPGSEPHRSASGQVKKPKVKKEKKEEEGKKKASHWWLWAGLIKPCSAKKKKKRNFSLALVPYFLLYCTGLQLNPQYLQQQHVLFHISPTTIL